jgi:uncharacterized membrane protein YdbT with pleckstrin-like domain
VGFPPSLINENEELVLDLRPHWFYMFEPTISLLGAVILGIIVINKDAADWIRFPVGVLILGVLVWWVTRYLRWITTNFVITSDRVVFRAGVIAKRGIEIPLERINTVFFNQSIFERMIGAGDLGIESAGERGSETFQDVRKPSAVQNEIYRQMELNSQRTYGTVRNRNQAAAEQPAAHREPTIPEQLEQLDDLRKRGVITDAEFTAKKAQLLDRM